MGKWIKRGVALLALLFIVVAAFPFVVGDQETKTLDPGERARLEKEEGVRFVTLSEGVTRYEWRGPSEGPTVVLVHGFTGPGAVWNHNIEALAEAGFHVLRYDLFGRGYSDRPHLRYTAEVFDQQLIDLLEHFEVEEKINLVGLSMGGAITAHFVDRHPERVNCFALLAPAGFNLDVPPLYAMLRWPGVGEWILKAFGDAKLPTALERMGVPEGAPYRDEFLGQLRYQGFKRALLSTYRNNPLLNLRPVYERVGETAIPALLIWGDEDHVVPFDHHEHVEETIPHVEFHAIEGGSHMANYQLPEVVNPILIDFLQRHTEQQEPAAEDPMEVNEAA